MIKTDSHTKLAVAAAVLVGLFALVAVHKYIQAKTAVAPAPKAAILVATSEIKEGATFGDEMLDVAEIPFEALSNMHIALPAKTDPGFAKALADAKAKIVGRTAKRLIAAKTPVFWIDVDSAPKTELTDLIGDDMRAVTMPVDSVSSVCNFIKPGSRVDIVLTATADRVGVITGQGSEKGPNPVITTVILQDVPVLATDRSYDLGSDNAGYGTLTLNVPVRAALLLVQARSMGSITYLLRNVRDTKVEADRDRVTVAPGTSFAATVQECRPAPAPAAVAAPVNAPAAK